ncbi:MAG: hypothetical protein JWO11_3812, partial [Nocardioides sp.]|nr:hypothetical protein [Nocardioides sp.]
DFGRDGCGGLTGWSVDNVTVSTCKTRGAGRVVEQGPARPAARNGSKVATR